MAGSWSVDFHPACEAWADGLEQSDAEALLAAVRVLGDAGPALGRPLLDAEAARVSDEAGQRGARGRKGKGPG